MITQLAAIETAPARVTDPRLLALVSAWPELPEALRAAVLRVAGVGTT